MVEHAAVNRGVVGSSPTSGAIFYGEIEEIGFAPKDSLNISTESKAETERGKDLGLTDDEVVFYDALAANESAVQAMGNDKLKVIAAELITKVRQSE